MTTDRCDRADCRAERHQHANDLGGVQLAALRLALALGEAPPVTLAEQLRAAREAAGLTQQDLAVRAGVSMMTVSRIERGATTESRGAVEKIAAALDRRAGDVESGGSAQAA